MKRAILLLALVLGACSSTPTTSPSATVYQAKNAFEVALVAAVQYNALPRCPSAQVCSDQATVDAIRKAAADARLALDAAERTVRDPSSNSSSVSFAMNAATNAVQALQVLLASSSKGGS